MKTITINRSDLDVGRSEYALETVERGHIPGVLSGAELKGAAREYGGHYARMRRRAAEAVESATAGRIRDGKALRDSRWVRCWVDQSGDPVRIEVR